MTPCMKQLQYFKRAFVFWNRNRFQQFRLITLKQYQKALNWDCKCFHFVKFTPFKFQNLSFCIIWNKLL